MSDLNDSQLEQIRSELLTKGKISAVKLYKDWTRCSLLEAKNAVEAIERDVEPPEPNQAHDGTIDENEMRQIDQAIRQGNKLEAVKLYRQFSGCSLMESKQFVESRISGKGDQPTAPPSTSAINSQRSGCFSTILLAITLSAGSAKLICHWL